jgi:hypothetical protein
MTTDVEELCKRLEGRIARDTHMALDGIVDKADGVLDVQALAFLRSLAQRIAELEAELARRAEAGREIANARFAAEAKLAAQPSSTLDGEVVERVSLEIAYLLARLLEHSISHYGNPKDETFGVGLLHNRVRALLDRAGVKS